MGTDWVRDRLGWGEMGWDGEGGKLLMWNGVSVILVKVMMVVVAREEFNDGEAACYRVQRA